jgi:plastocyanin
VQYLPHHAHLALVDETMSGNAAAGALAAGEAAARAAAPPAARDTATAATAGRISIDNFAFAPKMSKVASGRTITWTNHDDVPHRIESTTGAFAPSPVLDTRGSHTVTLATPGTYPYFCSLHPTMTGQVVVT